MDCKYCLYLLILCCSITPIISSTEDAVKRYVILSTNSLGDHGVPNYSPLPVAQNRQNIAPLNNQNSGSNLNTKLQNFIQYEPAASYQIVEAPLNRINRGSIQNPGSTTTTTTYSYRFSNGNSQEAVKKEVHDNLSRLIDLVEKTNLNANSFPVNQEITKQFFTQVQGQPQQQNQQQFQFTQTNSNQPQFQFQPQNSNQPQIQFQQQNSNQPQFRIQPQNSNQPQFQIQYPNQQQPNYQSQNLNQQQFQNRGQNQFPQNQFQYQSPGSVAQKKDDDKISIGAFKSLVGGVSPIVKVPDQKLVGQ